MSHSLEPLFNPRTVALIGASARPGKVGNVVLKHLAGGSFKLYPVNPNESELMGLRCYPSISSVPGRVDLAVVALPAREAVGAARECVESGTSVVIVSSSGFSESGGDGIRLEAELAAAFKGGNSRLLGPNTMGVLVPGVQLDTLFIPKDRSPRPRAGDIAILSQSGAVAVSFLEKARASGAGISACVGLGNMLDISETELITFLAKDPETKCIALYLESFSNGKEFLKVAEATVLSKPMVILKSGRTPAGSRAAASHTGAIASSSDSVVEGALRQACVSRAYDEEELIDTARALAYLDHIRGDRVCVVASAGGFGVMAADLIESSERGAGLRMAVLSETTTRALRALVPSYSSVTNPVDLTSEVSDTMYDEVLGVLQRDEGVDVILMSLELQPPKVTQGLVEVTVRRCENADVPIVACVFGMESAPNVVQVLEKNRIPSYPTVWRGVRAIMALSLRGSYVRRRKG